MREALEKIDEEDASKRTRAASAQPQVPAQPTPPAGWYPHPTMAATQRYWDGEGWTENIAPIPTPQALPPSRQQTSQILVAALVAGTVIGLVMSLQSASLLTGTGTIWTGVAITVGSAIVTWIVSGLPTWVRVICVVAALIAISNAVSVESQLEDKRQEINEILH